MREKSIFSCLVGEKIERIENGMGHKIKYLQNGEKREENMKKKKNHYFIPLFIV